MPGPKYSLISGSIGLLLLWRPSTPRRQNVPYRPLERRLSLLGVGYEVSFLSGQKKKMTFWVTLKVIRFLTIIKMASEGLCIFLFVGRISIKI